MSKRGISAVVAVVLMILITVAGVTVIWTAIVPMIKDNLEFSELDGRISVVTSGGYTTYDGQKKLAMVQIKRDVDDGEMNRTRVIFSINGSSYGSTVVAPESGLTRVYIFNLSGYGEPYSVSVVPIFIVGGREKEGSVTSDIIMPKGIISIVSGTIYELESGNVSIVTECNDGIDNDGDTFIDYPSDPGCTDSLDDDETTPAPSSISFVRSAGSGGTSFTFDIGTASTDRLVVVIAGDESSGTSLTGVSVDGNNCNLVVSADNPVGAGNHQEMWYCDEDDLGSSGGSVSVSISGGDSDWATHAHLYTGVDQRSEEHTSELQSHSFISYAVFCLKKKKRKMKKENCLNCNEIVH